MNTRSQTGAKDLNVYKCTMDRFSNYMISRPADGAVDASNNLIMGLGKSRPYETHGALPIDIESILFNRGTVLEKHGHAAQSFNSSVMQSAGDNEPVPMYSIPRFENSARDSKSAPMPPLAKRPVDDIQPIFNNTQLSGMSSRQFIRSEFTQH